jgi:hypothetical protein
MPANLEKIEILRGARLYSRYSAFFTATLPVVGNRASNISNGIHHFVKEVPLLDLSQVPVFYN